MCAIFSNHNVWKSCAMWNFYPLSELLHKYSVNDIGTCYDRCGEIDAITGGTEIERQRIFKCDQTRYSVPVSIT